MMINKVDSKIITINSLSIVTRRGNKFICFVDKYNINVNAMCSAYTGVDSCSRSGGRIGIYDSMRSSFDTGFKFDGIAGGLFS